MTAAHFMLRWKARGGSLWRCWKILGAVATLLPSVWIVQNAVKITVKSNDSGIEKDVILNPYVRAKSISFSNSIPTLLIKNKTGVEVTETAYSLNDNKTFNIGLTVIGENGGEASAVPVINITGDSIITIKDGKATLGDNAGVATVTASIDGEES